MRIRSFFVAYALVVVALLLFADRRPISPQQNRYSHVVDLTDTSALKTDSARASSGTRIVAPADLIPGTWTASQIPAERLIAPLVVMNLESPQITLDDIEGWESRNGMMPQGAIVAIRSGPGNSGPSDSPMPITAGAVQ